MSQPFLQTSVEYLKGAGPQRAELLSKELGIKTYGDLLYYFPFRYVDRSKYYKVKEVTADLPYVQLKGTITSLNVIGKPRAQRLVGKFKDDTGTLDLVWF